MSHNFSTSCRLHKRKCRRKRLANRTPSLLPDLRAFPFHVCTNNLQPGPVTSEFLPGTATNFGSGTTSTFERTKPLPHGILHQTAAPQWRRAQEAEAPTFSFTSDNTSATWRIPSLKRDRRIRGSMTALLERRNQLWFDSESGQDTHKRGAT